MWVVPLKFMCSTQCDTPVRPVTSSFDPTLYQHQTDASGAVCTSATSTFRPLSRTADVILLSIIPAAPSHSRTTRVAVPNEMGGFRRGWLARSLHCRREGF